MTSGLIGSIISAVGWILLTHAFDQGFAFYMGGAFVTLAVVTPLCAIRDLMEEKR